MHASWNITSAADLVRRLEVDSAKQALIAAFPQRSMKWKEARYGRLTSSNFAAAAGLMGKAKRNALLKDMVWPEFAGLTGYASKLAQHGVDHEDIARDIFVADRLRNGSGLFASDPRICIKETGLLVSLSDGWLACSPDFVMQEPKHCREAEGTPPINKNHVYAPYRIALPHGHAAYLSAQAAVLHDVPTDAVDAETEWITVSGEIKCPAYGDKQLYSETGKHDEYGFPKYYIPQIQGVMNLMHWPFTDTIVYTPTVLEVTRFARDEAYWSGFLYPALRRFYFEEFLPLLDLRCQGKLEPGCIVQTASPAPALSVSRHARIENPLAILQGLSEEEVPLLVHKDADSDVTKKPPVQTSVPCALPQWLLTGKLPVAKKK
jgi:hypothetical protein